MAKITITHIQFRGTAGDQPRFAPGPDLRRLGLKPRALRHRDGRWFSIEEVLTELRTVIEPEIERRRAAAAAGKALRPQRRRYITTGEIIETYIRGKISDARPVNTIADYQAKRRTLEKFDPEFYTAPAESIEQPAMFRLYEALRRKRGLATAVGVVRIVSASYSYAIKTGAVRMLMGNPCAKLGMETPPPRVRAGSIEEMQALVAAARHMGRIDAATAILLGLWTGQRQGDRLALVDAGEMNGRTVLRQSKTGRIVSIPQSPTLIAALAEARQMKAALPHRVIDAAIIVNQDTGRAFHRSTYAHLFAEIRGVAVAGVRDDAGGWLLKACPSLVGFTDQDLRDTAVTWLVRAGCDLFEVASITGHDLETVAGILRHYLADHPERADAAIAKMVAWYDGQIVRKNEP